MAISRRGVLLLMTSVLVPATTAAAAPTVLRGTVNYRERMTLPPTATVLVQLLDVSRADAPAAAIAEDRITGATGSPIPYRLEFDQDRIDLRHSYALQARIFDGDRLLFVNAKHHTVFAGGRNNTRIMVRRIATTPAPPSAATGRWLAEDLLGGGVLDRLQTVLEIAPDGVVTGTGGCNRFNGRAKIEDDRIAFGPIASTKMACTPAAMDQEHKLHRVLEATRAFRVDAVQRKLLLFDSSGNQIARLAAM